jgi:hypothetical protein
VRHRVDGAVRGASAGASAEAGAAGVAPAFAQFSDLSLTLVLLR